MKNYKSLRGWGILLFLYIIGLTLFIKTNNNHNNANSPTNSKISSNIDIQCNNQIIGKEISSDKKTITFEVKRPKSGWENVKSCTINIIPEQAIKQQISVQAIIENDSRYSFGHSFSFKKLNGINNFKKIPFLNGQSFWSPIDNESTWSKWERMGVRKFRIKIFSETPIAQNIKIKYSITLSSNSKPKLQWINIQNKTFKLGENFVANFDYVGFNGNPFDSKAHNLICEITAPDGKEFNINPFLYQNFQAVIRDENEVIMPTGQKFWKIRFRPMLKGKYKFLLKAKDQVLMAGKFTVLPGRKPDFVRISKKNPRYFAHQNGKTFFPIGWNIINPIDRPYGVDYVPYLPKYDSLYQMKKMIDDIADNGGNFFRFWMSDWFAGIEWNKTVDNYLGIGKYNLKHAWIIDQILKHCEQRGVKVLFASLNHVRLTKGYGWEKNPFSKKNGGVLLNSRDYWNDKIVEKSEKKRLNYIVSRFANSPAIHSFNYMSEPDLVSRWRWRYAKKRISKMLLYFKKLDPCQHIVSNHINTHNRDFSFYKTPGIEFVHSNAYPSLRKLSENQVYAIRAFSKVFENYKKPIICSEYGGNSSGDPSVKMKRDTLNGLYASLASRMSGTPLTWWWNFNYGESLSYAYKSVALIMKDIDLIQEDKKEYGYWLNRKTFIHDEKVRTRAFMVGNNHKRIAYVFNFYTTCRTHKNPSHCQNIKVSFNKMKKGEYVAEYWNMEKGKIEYLERFTVANNTGTINPPKFTHSWVVKIYPENLNKKTMNESIKKDIVKMPAIFPTNKWQWIVKPMLSIINNKINSQCVYTAKIALPKELWGSFPVVTNKAKLKVLYNWHYLKDKKGWQLKIPANQKGNFVVKANKTQVIAESKSDGKNIGTLLSVSGKIIKPILTPEDFEKEFSERTDIKTVQVKNIDQLENPTGRNDNYISHYQAPLFVPRDGKYTFSINSDDGSFIKIDNKVAVVWLGNHNMEYQSRPLKNKWSRQKTISLKKGVHLLEMYHQECGGSQLARVGWIQPETKKINDIDLIFSDLYKERTSSWAVIAPEFLDGRIPCSIEFIANNKTVLSTTPTRGLELRRPRKRIFTVALGKTKKNNIKYFEKSGWHNIDGIAIWVDNNFYQKFSIEYTQGISWNNVNFFKIISYNLDLPLSISIDGKRREERVHKYNQWEIWNLKDDDKNKWLAIYFKEIELLKTKLKPWISSQKACSPPKNKGLKNIYYPTLSTKSFTFPSEALKNFYPTNKQNIMPKIINFNLWDNSSEKLLKKLSSKEKGFVILELDMQPYLKGITVNQLYLIYKSYVTNLLANGYTPILVLNKSLDFDNITIRQMAQGVARLRDTYSCPFIDLRFYKK